MRDEMDRMLEHGWPRLPSLFHRESTAGIGGVTVPDLDVRENTTSITVEAELPGVDEKDVTVTLANGLLTIKGEKKQEKGVLRITAAKKPEAIKAERKIEIKET